MAVNKNFTKAVEKSGKSLEEIALESGLPYADLSDLYNGKANINDCSYDFVNVLAAFFGCGLEQIANPTQLMANVRGEYNGIQYWWQPIKDGIRLQINDNGKICTLKETDCYTQIRFRNGYNGITRCLIDLYLKEKEAKDLLARHSGMRT